MNPLGNIGSTKENLPKTADEFGIGYAPTSEFSLFDYLSQKNFKQEIMIKSGLFREKPRGGKLVSSFQGRLMIPIHEKLGRIVVLLPENYQLLRNGVKKRLRNTSILLKLLFFKKAKFCLIYILRTKLSNPKKISSL